LSQKDNPLKESHHPQKIQDPEVKVVATVSPRFMPREESNVVVNLMRQQAEADPQVVKLIDQQAAVALKAKELMHQQAEADPQVVKLIDQQAEADPQVVKLIDQQAEADPQVFNRADPVVVVNLKHPAKFMRLPAGNPISIKSGVIR
jgi:hypothetical protein